MSAPKNSGWPEQIVCLWMDSSALPPVLPGFNARLSAILTCIFAAALRGRGILTLAPFFPGKRSESGSVGVVVCGTEVIGLFAVTDWRTAVGTLLAEMEANGLAHSFKIGRLCDDEGIWRPCFPKDSTEDFEAIAQRYLEWAKTFVLPGADDLKSLL
jgi:hypothetical protein